MADAAPSWIQHQAGMSDERSAMNRMNGANGMDSRNAAREPLQASSSSESEKIQPYADCWFRMNPTMDNMGSAVISAALQMGENNPIRLVFRVCALGLGVLMVMSSVVELFNVSSFTRLCIAMYNLLFAAVLMLHESQGFVTCDEVDWTMRRYFGLLYGHMGRAIFIIFIAFLNFALTDAAWWGTITGLLLLALGVSMVLIYMKYPHLLDEAPGLGDLKTPAPRPQGYAPPPAMPSTAL